MAQTIVIDGIEYDLDVLEKRLNDASMRETCEASLYEFLVNAWKYIDSAPFTPGWAMEAVAEHLEAVADGDIKRLIINIPPRCSKPVIGSALIMTHRGLVPLCEVVVGDHVWTHRSRLRRVEAVHQQGVLPVLRITTKRGRQVRAAADHPFLTADGWKNLGAVTKEDVVAISTPMGMSVGEQTIPVGEAVISVEPAGEAECFCLTVEEDSTFVANGFIVHNSTLVSVAFPAWTWAQPQLTATSGAGVQFLCASYAQQLVLRDSVKCRRLISSPWYQDLWKSRFSLVGDQNTKSRFANDKGGERLITSVDSGVTGEGGNIIIIDDPNAANEAFSEATIMNTIEWWDGTMSTRLNDPKTGAYVIIQQRLAEDDLTGHILNKDHLGEWTLLCLPMRYEWRRHCVTGIGWQDPRGLDTESEPLVLLDENGLRFPRDTNAQDELEQTRENSLLWPERFGEKEVLLLERQLGPFSAAGQLQQSPEPKGGGVIKQDWWQLWGEANYPPMDFIMASLDTAYTTKAENDYSALTVWGVFSGSNMARATKTMTRNGVVLDVGEARDRAYGERRPALMLMFAWQARLELHELVKKVTETCKKMRVERLLIENKAAGHSVAQELRRLYQDSDFSVHLIDPKSMDKLSRLYSVQHIFAEGMVFAPDKTWADEVIRQTSQFPKGKHDDLVDTVSMAIRHLRDVNLLARSEEVLSGIEEDLRYSGPPPKPLYEV